MIRQRTLAAITAGFVGLTVAGTALLSSDGSANPAEAVQRASAVSAAADAARETLAKAQKATAAPTITAMPEAGAGPDSAFTIKRILPITGPIRYGEWHWDEAGVPDGPLVVTVDLEARVLSVFRNGYEIGATAVLLGTQEKPTPLGVFPITEKDADHVSNLYGAPMPYMLRLTNDGISIHGTTVENGYASHGCIGTPTAFAQKLFAVAGLGDRVFITRGKSIGMGDLLAAN